MYCYYNARYGNGDKNLPLRKRAGPPRRVVRGLDQHIAEVFREIREGKKISTEELATKAEIKQERLIKIEAGYVLPFITELEAMAAALGTKFWQIMQEAESRREREDAAKGK